MNTRILAAEYEYLAPTTLQEALTVLAEKEQVKVLAGGTDLIVKLKDDAIKDMAYMLDIKRIDELNFLCFKDDVLHIGALAKLSHIEKHPIIIEKYPALAEAIQLMASISVRNMGTMVGNICNASPVADSVIPAIVYQATIVLESLKGKREMPLVDFFVGPGISKIEKGELLTGIKIPCPKQGSGSAFLKKTRVRPDISKLSIAATVELDGDTVSACRIAMAAIAATPAYLKAVGDSMVGQKLSADLIAQTAALAAKSIKPIDDNRTTAEYRIHIAEVMTADVLIEAAKRAGGAL